MTSFVMRRWVTKFPRDSRHKQSGPAIYDEAKALVRINLCNDKKQTIGSFYRQHPAALSGANPELFSGLRLDISSGRLANGSLKHWAFVGPSSAGKTTLLQILRGQHVCIPASGRRYPYLESEEIREKDPNLRVPSRAIKYVGFDGDQGLGGQAPKGAYLSSRYESRREDTDFSLLDYLKGSTQLNPLQDIGLNTAVDPAVLERVVADLRLRDLLTLPVSNLSNGQTRRARIAKALLSKPELLLLDEPFMGLDPPSLISLSSMLQDLAEKCTPRLVLTLRPQDPIPYWVTHLLYLDGCQSFFMGSKGQVLRKMAACAEATKRGLFKTNFTLPSMQELGQVLTSRGIKKPKQYKILNDLALKKNRKGTPMPKPESEAESGPRKTTSASAPASTADGIALSRDGYKLHDSHPNEIGEALVEMEGVNVSYGDKSVLGNWSQEVNGGTKNGLWWTVRRGERWGIFGPNGSGKTTILSLMCSDHPQTYSLPIRLFGRSRLPEPGRLGISIFDIQARIGHSSPEIHNHMPKSLTLRKVLANAWADTFRGVPRLDDVANARIDACLRWFQQDLKPASQPGGEASASHTAWADEVLFGGLPFSSQRVALFLRAIIKQPDLIILDEAFGGMDDGVRDRCLLFLAHGETRQFASPSSRNIVKSEVSRNGAVTIHGLQESQALVCISHVKEEIPGSVREWICLPEAHTGKPARFGRLNGPIEGDYKRWEEIWDM